METSYFARPAQRLSTSANCSSTSILSAGITCAPGNRFYSGALLPVEPDRPDKRGKTSVHSQDRRPRRRLRAQVAHSLRRKKNIYGFLDTGNASSSDALGGALKYEFLTGKTEMAFSGWAKKGYNPMFGYDFSTRAGDFDILGELCVSRGDNLKRIRLDNGILDVYTNNYDWAPARASTLLKVSELGISTTGLKSQPSSSITAWGMTKTFLTTRQYTSSGRR